MLFYLRQGQARNYTFSNGFLNSTNPYPTSLPFEAPPEAILINALWFASLMCSLATGSFGMLVKQWLHEYLDSESMFPKRRIIERRLRRPQLAKWKVYEFAWILPILLHISLGLFFIGLCFFTASIDARLGRTSLVLASGWAFLIVMTTLAPLISPRCPYKLPTLKTMLVVGRKCVTRPLVSYCIVYIFPAASSTYSAVTSRIKALMSRIKGLTSRIKPLASMGRLIRTLNQTAAHWARWASKLAVPGVMKPDGQLAGRRLALLEEEEQIQDLESSGDYLKILLDIDRAAIDDAALPVIEEAAKSAKPAPDKALNILISLLRNRLGDRRIPQTVSPDKIFPRIDLSLLSHDAWQFAMKFAADILYNDSLQPTDNSVLSESRWQEAAVWILLSPSRFGDHKEALRALLYYFCDGSTASESLPAGERMLQVQRVARADPTGFGQLSRCLVAASSRMASRPCLPFPEMLSIYADLLSPQANNQNVAGIVSDLWEFLRAFFQWCVERQGQPYHSSAQDSFSALKTLFNYGILDNHSDSDDENYLHAIISMATLLDQGICTAPSLPKYKPDRHASGPARLAEQDTCLAVQLRPVLPATNIMSKLIVDAADKFDEGTLDIILSATTIFLRLQLGTTDEGLGGVCIQITVFQCHLTCQTVLSCDWCCSISFERLGRGADAVV
jgi:hypothetical protein